LGKLNNILHSYKNFLSDNQSELQTAVEICE